MQKKVIEYDLSETVVVKEEFGKQPKAQTDTQPMCTKFIIEENVDETSDSK